MGKKFVFIFIMVWAVFLPFSVFAQEDTAENLTSKASLSFSRDISLQSVTDGYYTTKIYTQQSDILTVSCEKDIYSLYIIFDRVPGEYALNCGGENIICGEYGFIHEYIQLPAPSKEFYINLPDGILCDIYLFGKGETPDFVQKWQEPYTDCDMLLLPTHADDEHIFFGGIMPYYAGEKGYKLQVAYLNNHWGEPYRPHELLNGLWTVGIKAYPVIPDFPDMYSSSLEHAKTIYNQDEILEYQTQLIRRFKPEVIIAHDIYGEYGHGTHMLNADTLIKALEISNDENVFPDSAQKYGVFNVPKTYIHLYSENQLVMEVDTPLSNFSGKTAYEMAVEGFAKHASQQQWFSVEKSGPYDCRKFGLYRSLVGSDTGKNDFFENINVFSDEKTQGYWNVVKLPYTPSVQKQTDTPKKFNFILIIGVLIISIFFIIKGVIKCKKKNPQKK